MKLYFETLLEILCSSLLFLDCLSQTLPLGYYYTFNVDIVKQVRPNIKFQSVTLLTFPLLDQCNIILLLNLHRTKPILTICKKYIN